MKLNPAAVRRAAINAVLIGLLATISVGCIPKVKWTSDYDPIMDQKVTELQVGTAALFQALKENYPINDQARGEYHSFLQDAQVQVSILQTRAQILEDNLEVKTMTELFTDLLFLYNEMENYLTPSADGTIPLDKPVSEVREMIIAERQLIFQQAFRAILTQLFFLKK